MTYDMARMIGTERLARGLWWSRAWSLVSGCTPISPACDHCWAAGAAHMRRNNPNAKVAAANAGVTDGPRFNGTVRFTADQLDKPRHVREPPGIASRTRRRTVMSSG